MQASAKWCHGGGGAEADNIFTALGATTTATNLGLPREAESRAELEVAEVEIRSPPPQFETVLVLSPMSSPRQRGGGGSGGRGGRVVSLIYEEEKRRQRERGRQWRRWRGRREASLPMGGDVETDLMGGGGGGGAPPPSPNRSLFLAPFPTPMPVDENERRRRRRGKKAGRWSSSFAPSPPPTSAAEAAPLHIRPRALAALRDTFAVASSGGRLKRPRIHVHFTYPRSLSECCCGCERGTDFLFVYVGLCNIFVLQFAVVVLLFFADEELPDPFSASGVGGREGSSLLSVLRRFSSSETGV